MPERHPEGYLVKLVRDDVVAMLGGDGTVTYRPMPPHEHARRLVQKLVEEAAEYAVDPCLEELAHVWEAIHAIAELKHGGYPVLYAEAQCQREQRGGFALGIGMYAIHPWDHEQEDADAA
jgi:predicted house-cleaning noncanonical NTP pyrophosphatase (MazG superfamily)